MSDERKPDFESEGVHEVDLADIPTELGLLPLRDTLLFPQAILPLGGKGAMRTRDQMTRAIPSPDTQAT